MSLITGPGTGIASGMNLFNPAALGVSASMTPTALRPMSVSAALPSNIFALTAVPGQPGQGSAGAGAAPAIPASSTAALLMQGAVTGGLSAANVAAVPTTLVGSVTAQNAEYAAGRFGTQPYFLASAPERLAMRRNPFLFASPFQAAAIIPGCAAAAVSCARRGLL
jgi:hypothetical protein